ncbi:MAG: hypothetical protein ACM3SU_02550 [Acidobacteriota bacterium]
MPSDSVLSLVVYAPVVAGAILAILSPTKKAARWAWGLLFVLMGVAAYLAQAEQGRRRDEAAAKNRGELSSQIAGLRDQNSRLLGDLENARKEIAALKDKIEAELPNPRRLSKKQTETLVAALRSHTSIVVIRHARTAEAQEYAGQLSDALTKAGWIPGFARFDPRQTDAAGVYVVTHAGAESSPGALALTRALRRAGIAVKTRVDEENIEPLTLYVGIQSARAKNANVTSATR